MKTRRLIHTSKDSFFEVFWFAGEVEIVAGAIGSKGRARRKDFALVGDADTYVADEIAKRLKQGFVEVTPDAPLGEQAKTAPRAKAAPELVADIVENPDDDAPRLVYADYLAMQADPLGELIVVQCERARLAPWDPKQKALADREDQLLLVFRKRWTPGLDDDVRVVFRRGFIEKLRIEHLSATTAGALDRAMAIAPLLHTLEMPGAASPLRVGGRASLLRLTGLYLRGAMPANLGAIVGIADLANLTRLGLRGCGLGRSDFQQLAMHPWRELELPQNTLGTNGVRTLVERLVPEVLEVLEIGSCGTGNDGVAQLAKTAFPRLRTLGLGSSGLTDRALAILVDGAFAAVTKLDVSSNAIGGAGFTQFLATERWPALREADLANTSISDAQIELLAASPLAARIVTLRLANNQLTNAAASAIATMPWPALRRLDLCGNTISAAMTKTLRERLPHVRIANRA